MSSFELQVLNRAAKIHRGWSKYSVEQEAFALCWMRMAAKALARYNPISESYRDESYYYALGKLNYFKLFNERRAHMTKLEELKRDVVRSLIDATFDEREVGNKREFITWLDNIETKIRSAKEVCINTL